MESLYRKLFRATVPVLILILSSMFFMPGEAVGQHSAKELPHIQKKLELLEKHLSDQQAAEQTSKSSGMLVPVASSVNLGSVDDNYTIFEADDSWNRNPNPNSKYNFALFDQGQPAGDINGDGINDFIVTGHAMDERTTAVLDDYVTKTAIFFGNNTSGTPDDFHYRKLVPVGDINGDGYADAIAPEIGAKDPSFSNTNANVYLGSETGYEESKVLYSGFGLGYKIVGFNDFNRDGFVDVLSYRPNYGDVFITWGTSNVYDLGWPETFPDVLSTDPSRIAVADVDQDSLQEIVELTSQYGDGLINILEVDTLAQGMPYEGILSQQNMTASFTSYNLEDNELYLADVNGSGYLEILVSVTEYPQSGPSTSTYILGYDTLTGYYSSTSTPYFNGSMILVGDLDNDGADDFIAENTTDTYKPFIAYSPGNLSTALSLDVDLSPSGSAGHYWEMTHNSRWRFGDLDGDGIDDVLLTFSDDNSIGRRIVSESKNFFLHQYPKEEFFNEILGTNEVGDLNGDGIEDFAMVFYDQKKLEIYYGGSSIAQTPDMTLNLGYFPLETEVGEFTGDGQEDLIILGWKDGTGYTLNLHEGGTSLTPSAAISITGSDVNNGAYASALYGLANIGDINEDGIDDFLTGSGFARDSTSNEIEYLNEAYIFYGGSISATPDVTIKTGKGQQTFAGERSTGLGDINGDSVNDFAVGIPYKINPDESYGQVWIYYGGEGKTYAEPDKILKPEDPAYGFGAMLASGDFTGDGFNDLAVGANHAMSGETQAPHDIHIYNGGADFDETADRYLSVPNFNLESSTGNQGYAGYVEGRLEVIQDFTSDNKEELLVSSSNFDGNSHAALYTFNNSDSDPTGVLKSPNKLASLGGYYDLATGDFNDDGQIDVVLTQPYDNNDAYSSSRVYRYGLPAPLKITKVTDVPDDQGKRVRIHVGGYLLEAMNQSIYGLDNWSVWQMTKDSSWTSLATVSPSNMSANYIDVTVNKTQPTNVDTVDYAYTFRLEAFDHDEGVIARSGTVVGRAYDNLAPSRVQNVAVSQVESTQMISWQSTQDNDVSSYEVVEAAPEDNEITVVGSSVGTNFTLPNDLEGVQNFAVRARDVNNNVGEISQPATAIYPQTVNYNMAEGWNLIGLPVDVGADVLQSVLDNVSNGAIYIYDGAYRQVEELKAGKGYWAKFSTADLYKLQGLPVTNLTMELQEGWNLISGVGGELPVSLVDDPDEIIVPGTIYAFNQMYAASDTLRPGNGYWVRASSAGTVTFTHPKLIKTQSASKTEPNSTLAKAVEEIEKNFNKITITDGTRTKELYFGAQLPDQISKLRYSLPPLAPGNIFDVRFKDDSRLAEKEEVYINVNRLEGTSLEIKINSQEPAETDEFLVREFAGGRLLSEYTMKADQQVQLKHKKTDSIYLAPSDNAGLTQSQIPEEFKLEQNYPNPFNPTTQIQYSVTEAATVKLEVFNILGRRVATLINKEQKPGNYRVTFDGSRLASGMYLYRLQAGSKVSTKKLILAK